MARIRIGTASWTDHDPFYPPEYNRADMKSQRIEYYARYFDVVEVDSTFYHLQPTRNFAMWAERTPDDFIFDVKAYGELTWHHRDDQGAPMTDGTVIVFADSADKWWENSRYVRAVRPDQQGHYEIKGLPAGEYLALAVDAVEDGMWNDPEYLESIRRYGQKVTISEGGSQSLTLTLVTR